MTFKSLLPLLLVVAGLFSGPANVKAAIVTISILDIITDPQYQPPNVGQSYSGTGFVGLYGPGAGSTFGHLFGIETTSGGTGVSRTALEASIGFLSGATINSATLSFQILDGGTSNTQSVTVTSFTADGSLEYFFAPPDNLGTASASVTGGSNSINVTSLVQARASASAAWLGLHLQGSTTSQWTYTHASFGGNADSAQVRLTVDFTPGNGEVPEPASLTLWGLGAIGCAFAGYRRRTAT